MSEVSEKYSLGARRRFKFLNRILDMVHYIFFDFFAIQREGLEELTSDTLKLRSCGSIVVLIMKIKLGMFLQVLKYLPSGTINKEESEEKL